MTFNDISEQILEQVINHYFANQTYYLSQDFHKWKGYSAEDIIKYIRDNLSSQFILQVTLEDKVLLHEPFRFSDISLKIIYLLTFLPLTK